MTALNVRVAGIGVYAPGLPNWTTAAAALRGEVEVDAQIPPKPAPPLLPAAERRRAPDTVLYAAQAAAEACAMAGFAPAQLPCIFGSTQGDIAITDYMCATLASTPQELSPTKFHNSVHNAAVGYWSIATECRAASTALSAWTDSFGASLLEAALQAVDSNGPVLLAVYDSSAVGPLRSVLPFDCGYAVALVLAPASTTAAPMQLCLRPAPPDTQADAPDADWARALLARNACADSLALLQVLAQGQARSIAIDAGMQFALTAEFQP